MLIKLFVFFTSMLLSSISLANDEITNDCNENLPIIEKSFFGTWVEDRGNIVSRIIYNSDNTFSGSIEKEDEVIHIHGTWSLDGNIKYLASIYNKNGEKMKGESIDEVLQITCNEYKYKNIKSGRIRNVKKIAQNYNLLD